MGASINRKQTGLTGAGSKDWIPLNRFTTSNVSIHCVVTGTINFDVEGTLARINQGETAVSFPITGLTGVTATTSDVIVDSPMEAIRVAINSGAGSVDFHVMQEGIYD